VCFDIIVILITFFLHSLFRIEITGFRVFDSVLLQIFK
jgi:hypothetical protein